ncbi:Protein kinase domain [Macleaya cordata]|uniref:Protein kinase domain n=1 Tax=Macleaya cordata TaxID=56857 RepID=A0A200QYW7_MACCD|nr:Protein kinase domain [Macleaya cordata]
MEWVKGEIIGRGSFGTVNLATPRRDCSEIPSLMAVKSSLVSQSAMLMKEKEILTHLNGCPQILRCFGDDLTIENGVKIYNVFLEFASKGNLSQLIKSSGSSISESDIRRYTKSITQGLNYIHQHGYVHSDIKPQNILLCSSTGKQSEVKIADFGLAKKTGQKSRVLGLIGTPLYMSPESICCNENEAPSDVWALGISRDTWRIIRRREGFLEEVFGERS